MTKYRVFTVATVTADAREAAESIASLKGFGFYWVAPQGGAASRHLSRAMATATLVGGVAPKPDNADAVALDAIAELLDGAEWSADTLDAIADIVRATGRKVDPPTIRDEQGSLDRPDPNNLPPDLQGEPAQF